MTNMAANSSSNEIDEIVPSRELFIYIVQGLLITGVCPLGWLANTICVFVMSQPSLKKGQCASANALHISMAVVDIIVLVCR